MRPLTYWKKAGGVQNALGQVFQLRLGGTSQAQAKCGGQFAEAVLHLAKDQCAFSVQATLRHALLLTPLYAHQTLAFFLFFEPAGDHLVRLLQVVHFRECFAGEPLERPAAKPFRSWVSRRWVPFSLAGTGGLSPSSGESLQASRTPP